MRLVKYWNRFPETVDLHSIKGDALIITLIIQGMTTRGQKGTEKIRAVVRSGKKYKANEDPEHICILHLRPHKYRREPTPLPGPEITSLGADIQGGWGG